MEDNRRDFLKKSTMLGLTGIATALFGKENLSQLENFSNKISGIPLYTLPPLPYPYDALEPFIDKQTMEIHHTKHHQGYVDKLNKALENYKGDSKLEAIFNNASKVDSALKNNAGGHYNHSLFWDILKPAERSEAQNVPVGMFAEVIAKQFKTFEDFKKEFSDKAVKVFGSGWCWLILQNEQLKIVTTSNQDNPLMDNALEKGKPLLALDVWEHAYYLKYQNKRVDYIANWWNIVNWPKVEELYITK